MGSTTTRQGSVSVGDIQYQPRHHACAKTLGDNEIPKQRLTAYTFDEKSSTRTRTFWGHGEYYRLVRRYVCSSLIRPDDLLGLNSVSRLPICTTTNFMCTEAEGVT